jgi:hypothetical protein
MGVDANAISAAVAKLLSENQLQSGDRYLYEALPFEDVGDLLDRLVEEHGFDELVAALGPHHGDRYIAELLFFAFWTHDKNMLAVFSEAEIARAATEHLRPFGEETTNTRGLPSWGWSALFQHDYGHEDHLTDEQHFRILIDVIARVPTHDRILWMIGDGPLAHALGDEDYQTRVDRLAATDPKVARILKLPHD